MKALGRLGRKRRDSNATPDATPAFAVDSCECLVDGPFALLRLTGTGVNPPASLLVDGDKPASFEPLPGPDNGAPDGVWRAAFALPAELAEPGALLWLLDGGQHMTDVHVPATPSAPAAPEPVAPAEPPVAPEPRAEPRAAEPPPPPPAPADDEDDPRARKLVEAWSEAANLRDALTDREQELAKALHELLAARTDVDPLRERAAQLTHELESVRAELEVAQRQAHEARERATETTSELEALRGANAAELDALRSSGVGELAAVRAELTAELDRVRSELETAEPRLAEAVQATERAEQEAVALRDQVQQLEAELLGARSQIEANARQADEDRERLASAAADQQRTAEELQTELEQLKEQPKSRRLGFGRRSEDSEVAEVRAELEGRIAAQRERIEQLEQEAASFAERRDEALAESLRERVVELEEEVRQHAATGEDLRALLESEREQVSVARAEARDLKDQLATASAKRAAAVVAPPAPPAVIAVKGDDAPAQAAADPPPWSALDDELLARIEKAKLLTS